MKKAILFTMALLLAGWLYSHGQMVEPGYSKASKEEPEAVDQPEPWSDKCPLGKLLTVKVADCFECHTKDLKLKEIDYMDAWRLPHRTRYVDGGKSLYYYLSSVDDEAICLVLDYAKRNRVNKVIVEIHSPGGSLFNAWRVVGMLEEAKSSGMEIETRIYGFAASAGFLIFSAGDKRLASRTAELMWHELYTFKMFSIEGPSDSEDNARVLRHLQDTANTYIASKTNLSKDKLDEFVRKREYWIRGAEALEIGLATSFLGK